jgi:hypothetical protein
VGLRVDESNPDERRDIGARRSVITLAGKREEAPGLVGRRVHVAGADALALLGIGHRRGSYPMGYFDGLTSGNFKTAQDGQKLFFPWGYLHRGYVLTSERDAERMRQQLKTYYIVLMAAIIGTSAIHAFIVSAAVAALGIVFYAIWSRRQVAGLQPAGETMSFRESTVAQARAYGARRLWMLEGCALLLVAASIFIYVTDPTNRPMALLTLIFFGCCAAVIAYMLVIRGRASPAP